MTNSSAASVLPSLSVTGEHSGSTAQCTRSVSPVWNYLEYDIATGKSVCQVEIYNNVICTTNLKQH